MRRPLIVAAALLAPALHHGVGFAAQSEQSAAECQQLLDRTVAAMDARSSLKEEFATGLMWLRLDALEALEAGDTATCLELTRRAAALLKVD